MIVKIDKFSHDMRGITKIDNKITFIDRTLPLEVVKIKITKNKKSINEGKVISILEKSPDRKTAICPYYDKCGGCSLLHVDYVKGVMYKRNNVVDIIKRYSGLDVKPDIFYNENIYNYRNKITLRVSDGYLSLIGESLVKIEYCYLVNDRINEIIGILNNSSLLGSVKDVTIRGTKDIMVIINGIVSENDVITLLRDRVSSIVINGRVVFGSDYIVISVGKFNYAVFPDSFFQVNSLMISYLYDQVLSFAGCGNKLLDLYCGAGTIGIYLASKFKEVKGVEINKDAINGANLNKKINNISNISFELAEANEVCVDGYDVIVVDPPRSGLDKITVEKILLSSCERVIYVSCNPMTLARDLNILKSKYDVGSMKLFDMFPNTNHVECVCVLYRKKA